MNLDFNQYLKFSKNQKFLLLLSIIFLGQVAASFFILSQISSVFLKTQSNFGVSSVILSFTVPSLLFVAFAGLAADIFDRRKIMIFTYISLSLIVTLIILSNHAVYASIPLSFVYFALNTFFIPASSASTAQLVKKKELLLANSLFVFTLAAGVISGLIASAIIQFFFGTSFVLIVCVILLAIATILSLFLPYLSPHQKKKADIISTIGEIYKTFFYIIGRRRIWFFFFAFALVQAVIAFGITLAPGFFHEVVGINIEKSPLFVFPLIGIGVISGVLFTHQPKISEGRFVTIGNGSLGIAGLILGLIIKSSIITSTLILLFPIGIFLIIVGFGALISLVAARTALQKNVPHNFQGTVFAANIIISSLFSIVASPMAATFEVLVGYFNLLILAGFALSVLAISLYVIASKWKF